MKVLAVDDVGPALDELRRLLSAASGVEAVETAPDALTAVRLLQAGRFDVVFLDIAMPGMDGMELAALFGRMAEPPAIVFVTAFDEHAAAAYQIGAVDYLLKPISAERLAAALDRVRRFVAPDPGTRRPPVDALAAVPIELGGRTRFVRRDDVRFAEAQGDYVRLHTPEGAHLLRIPISRLEGHWADAGFLRVHRGFPRKRGARHRRAAAHPDALLHRALGEGGPPFGAVGDRADRRVLPVHAGARVRGRRAGRPEGDQRGARQGQLRGPAAGVRARWDPCSSASSRPSRSRRSSPSSPGSRSPPLRRSPTTSTPT